MGALLGTYSYRDLIWDWHINAGRMVGTLTRRNGENYSAVPYQVKFHIPDHLGSTRVSYNIRFSTPTGTSYSKTTASKHSYRPFGKVYREYLYGAQDKFLFTGKEQDGETRLQDFGARGYDPNLGRFLSVDPLAGKFPAWSSYNYCYDNPLIFKDPTGKAASPIYDFQTGTFLGTDKEGFKGEVLFMNVGTFNILGGNNNIEHSEALRYGSSVDQMLSGNHIEAIANAFTDITSQTDLGTSVINTKSMLHNGTISLSGRDKNGEVYTYNGVQHDNNELASYHKNGVDGKMEIGYNMETGKSLFHTVENIQNTFIHEFLGHGINGWGNATNTHKNVYELQMSHSTWTGTTPDFKAKIKDAYKTY